MTATHRSSARRRMRMLAIPIVASVLAVSCGGGNSDGDVAETPSDTAATSATDAPSATATVADEPASTDAGPADTQATTAPDDTSDGTPVVVTLAPEENVDPVVGGTLRYGLEADVNGINPAASSLSAPGLMMGNSVFDTLAASTPDGGWVPYLAESFTPSDDLKSWTMTLRPDILFHDGTPFNADAVVANFESQRNHPLVGLAVKPFFPEENAIEVVDDLTVVFHLLDAHANYPTYVTGQLGMMASPTWLAAAAADGALNQAPVGTGPFKFESRSQDSVTRFVRNDDWWGGEVYLDAVEFYPVTDPDARVDLMFGNELEALQTTDQGPILDLQADDTIQNVLDDSGEESFAMMNTAAAPFDDIRAREALAQATPIALYNELIGLGVNRPAAQRFIPESPYYNPDLVQAGDNPDRAVELATEYCAERGTEENPILGTPTCTDGKINIELQWSGPAVVQTRIADLLDEGWSVAFNVTFDELLQDEHISQTAFGQYNVNTWRQFGADDPAGDNVWLLCRTIGGISLNWPRYCDPDRDALLLAAQASTDEAERASLYQQAEASINAAFTYIFFNHTLWDNAFTENVHGVCDRKSPEGDLLKCASNGRTWFSSVWME